MAYRSRRSSSRSRRGGYARSRSRVQRVRRSGSRGRRGMSGRSQRSQLVRIVVEGQPAAGATLPPGMMVDNRQPRQRQF